MRKLINPIEFASLVVSAQAQRSLPGVSQIEAVRRACLEYNISDDWAAPLLSFINDSPAAAEAWAARIFESSFAELVRAVESARL